MGVDWIRMTIKPGIDEREVRRHEQNTVITRVRRSVR